MYLWKIEILGFKAFAQRVVLRFDKGVTAIVGPNGCGKTNIVDAIRWALGEQRYSALRSDKMEDIIFSGTKNRKPLSMAEVSLTIEDTGGVLPTEYSEVTITRRVYRSGESEYLLNRAPCRLKDVVDLFMDTGMGPDAYSVIELKMVETILSDKADERRRLFEEAAGVTKYKHRRRAAYRKLEGVQQDLVRVNDIVKEVQKTVNSLERQAKRAGQYNEVSQRLKNLEIELLEREYAYLHGRFKELENRLSLATMEKDKIDDELARQEELLEQLRLAMGKTEENLVEVQREAAAHVSKIHGIEDLNLVANERRSSLNVNIDRCGKENVDLRIQRDKLQNDRLVLIERRMKLQGEVKVADQEYQSKKSELEVFAQMFAGKKSGLQKSNDDAVARIHAIAEKRGEHEKLRSRIENVEGRVERAQEDSARYELEIKQMDERVQRMTAEDKELRRRFVEAEMQLYQQELAKKQLQEEIDSIQHKSIAFKTEVERKSAKRDFLRGLIEGEEGGSEGAKFLFSQEKWKHKHLTTVADLVDANERYRIAIEAALGEAANLLVVEQPEDAYAAIEDLRKNEKGKATFVVLNRIPRIRSERNLGRIGFTRAIDAVQVQGQYRSLINFLLDGVVLTENLEQAKKAVPLGAGVRCVTLDGQIVSSWGMVRGGSLRQGEGGFIGKQAQIAELEEGLAQLQQGLEGIKTEQAEKIKAHSALDLNPYREAVKAVEKEMTAIEVSIAQGEFQKSRASDGIVRNHAELEQLTKEKREIQQQIEALSPELDALERSKGDLDRRVLASSAEVEILERGWSAKAKMVNDLEIRLLTVQNELRNAERELEYGELSITDIAASLARREEEIVQAREEIARLGAEMVAQDTDLRSLHEHTHTVERRRQGIDREYAQHREEIHRIEMKIKDDRRLHDDALGTVNDVKVKITEITTNIEHLKERAKNEFERELELHAYPDAEWVDFAARREDVRQLKDKIRALGAINFAAFDEFKIESERLQFLTSQRDDLLDAERTLLSTIEEINATAQKRFLDTFALIRENFIKTFRGLFDPGDECDLRLQEDGDPLEAPIEIIAKPRGKRPTSIELLSGGEKTLTAIALLFAIYLVKPSPFCILDEVDAPLDDSNIDRYTRILHRFSDNTQFIVVTHNKRTMEAANALYGVTMEEEGVSKIVTVRFTEGARVESAAIASGV